VPAAFTERRHPRRFRILHISMNAFLDRFILHREGEAVGPAERQPSAPSGEKSTPWKSGVTRLDEQYDELFRLVRQFQAAMKASLAADALAESLAPLVIHVEGHLALEEAYLEHIAFPATIEHKSAHRAFQHQLHSFHQRLLAGDQNAGLELSQLLYAWVRTHVLKEDPIWSAHAKARRRR